MSIRHQQIKNSRLPIILFHTHYCSLPNSQMSPTFELSIKTMKNLMS